MVVAGMGVGRVGAPSRCRADGPWVGYVRRMVVVFQQEVIVTEEKEGPPSEDRVEADLSKRTAPFRVKTLEERIALFDAACKADPPGQGEGFLGGVVGDFDPDGPPELGDED